MCEGGDRVDPTIIGAVAADVLAEAIVAAVLSASGLSGIPAARDLVVPC